MAIGGYQPSPATSITVARGCRFFRLRFGGAAAFVVRASLAIAAAVAAADIRAAADP